MSPINSRPPGMGMAVRQVTIDEIILEKQVAVCVDAQGVRRQVPLRLRRAKGGWPQQGETWWIAQDFGQWTFAAIVGDAEPITITASRLGADPLAVELLDALLALGLVKEPESDTREDY